MYYQNYHKHTSYSNGGNFKDSPVTHKDYFEAMLPLAEKGIPQIYSAFEHGWQSPYGRIYNDLEAFNKEHKKDNPNYKDITMTIGLEGYWVLDHSGKDKTNNHICLIAKNENGRKALNFYNAMTFITQEQIDNGNAKRFFNYEGNTPYTYFKNRWDIDLLLKLPKDDILVTTACVGFYGYAKRENETQLDFTKTDEVIRILNNHFTSFYLEVQANNTDFQIKVNQHLVELHNKLNIPLISATDSHYIYPGQKEDREYMQKSQNNGKLPYSDEDENYMDFPSCEELIKRYKVQNVLTDDLIKEAIENTNVMLDYAVTLDRSLKVPSLPQLKNKSQTEKNKFLWNLLIMELKKQAHDLNKNKIKEYKEAIKKEFNEIVKCNMADYFIDDYFIVKKGLKNGGSLTKTGRGSGCGEFINKLLGLTSIDRINAPVELYPERFLTATRILESKTPPDIDNNISEREPFIEAQRQILGDRSSFDLLAVGTLKYKSAFKMFARANNLEPNIQNDITKQIEIYEKAKKHTEEDEEVSVYDYVDEKYHNLIDGCQKYRGIADNLKSHPCGTVLYDGDVISDIGVILVKSESTKRECWVCLQESITIDSFGLVKNDWLVVDSIGLIHDIYKLIGKDQPSINELSTLVENDKSTWDIYAKGQTMLINQVEKQKSKEKAMLFKPKNIYELTQFVAGIRPSFSSMLKTFLNRTHFEYSIPSLDKLLQDEFCDSSFILYQEQLMKVLDYAGFPLSETYTIIKAISKKKTHVIMDAKNKFIPNFAKHIIDNKEAETETEAINTSKAVWKIIEDSAAYGFNCSHAYSMALDSVQLAYLKAHYPYEFYQACLQRYTRKNDKNKVIDIKQEMAKFTNIKVENVLFGKPCTKYTVDKEHHLITQDISGVKGIQKIAGNILDSLIGKKYDKFVDIYVDLKERGLNKTTIATLIGIDCFREYGSILKIQKLFLFLEEFRGQKGFKKTIKKAGKSVDIYKPYFDIIAKYSKETAAQYKVNDVMGMLREIENSISNNPTPILLKASLENKYLGFTTLTDENLSNNLYLVQDIEANKWGTHFVTLYQLNSGKIESYRVNKEIYNNLPLLNSDVICGVFANFKGKTTLNCYNIKVRVETPKKKK